jgi:CPA1 family monovalent cation:H+ antiporter
MPAPTFAGSLVVSWAGMRGIVTLAAALALPDAAEGGAFPYRGLIVLTAFAVVVGTLILQGLTLAPLLRFLRLEDDDPVGREAERARRRVVEAALTMLDGEASRTAETVRLEFSAHMGGFVVGDAAPEPGEPSHDEVHRRAVDAARRALIAMRDVGEIGDDAFHRLEEALDRAEMGFWEAD